jgi:hypothetical protein
MGGGDGLSAGDGAKVGKSLSGTVGASSCVSIYLKWPRHFGQVTFALTLGSEVLSRSFENPQCGQVIVNIAMFHSINARKLNWFCRPTFCG